MQAARDQLAEAKLDANEAREMAEDLKEQKLPRSLTTEQKENFRNYFKNVSAPRLLGVEAQKPRIVICHMGDEEAYHFALEVRALLNECGFDAPEISYEDKYGLRVDFKDDVLGAVSRRPPGISIGVISSAYPPAWAGRVQGALTILNGGNVNAFPMNESAAKHFTETDLVIVVGKKPEQ